MSYNRTRDERRNRAASDLAKKLKLEVMLKKDMKSLFKKISKAARYMYIATGGKLNVFAYKEDFRNTLAKHYRRVIRNFQPQMQDEISAARKKAATTNSLNQVNSDYVATQSDAQANQLISTTQKNLNAAYAAALAAYVYPDDDAGGGDEQSGLASDDHNAGEEIDRAAVADAASDIFDADSENRSTVIATTETQGAAETAKTNAASNLAGVSADQLTKEWQTIMDGRERESHALADGQTQSFYMPFIVQGEALMYPGDNSLGASASNIINCRCSVQYIFPD